MYTTLGEQKTNSHKNNKLSQQKQGQNRQQYAKKEHRRIVGSTYVQYM